VTDENRRANIRDELRRAAEAERAAAALLELALAADAMSRAYYALFHWVRALLLTRGVEPRSHAGAVHLFNVEIVAKGSMDPSHNRLLGGLQRLRELADYDSALVFSVADARTELERVRAFAAEARALLLREGWIDP